MQSNGELTTFANKVTVKLEGVDGVDIEKLRFSCRVCMAKKNKMKDVFDTEGVIDSILYCTGLQVIKNDGLPTRMCYSCLDNLAISHRFKTNCLRANEMLMNIFSEVKTEPDTVDNNEDYNDGFNDGDDQFDDFDVKIEFDDRDDDEAKEQRVRKSVRLKKEKDQGPPLQLKPVIKRGPYKKSNKPRRLKKLKFTRLQCVACNMKFKTKAESEAHKKEFHKDNDNWICEVCGKLFLNRSTHYTHVKSHLPPKYKCEQCDYKTVNKTDLVKHVRIHLGLKLYQCEFCTNSFYTSSNLTSHIQRFHHGIKRFQCTMCDRRFYDRTKLNRHIDSHNEIKRHECEVCHSCFTRRCYWKKHLERQHGIIIPPQRPGRQRSDIMVSEDSKSAVGKLFTKDLAESFQA